MKVLVTGSAGQLGSYLAERLGERYDVVGVDICTPAWKEVRDLTVRGDVRDAERMRALTDGVDVIIHAAARVSVEASLKDPLEDASHNIDGTLTLLECAREKDIHRFIYVSSAAIYGEPERLPISEDHHLHPLSPYGVSKMSSEMYCTVYHRTLGLPVVCIRPFNIYSDRQDPSSPYSGVITRFWERISSGEPPVIYGTGRHTRDFIDVDDVIRMIETVIRSNRAVGKTYNCGTGRETSIAALASLMVDLSGKDLTPVHAPERPGDIVRSAADMQHPREDLGFEPAIPLEKGLARLLGTE